MHINRCVAITVKRKLRALTRRRIFALPLLHLDTPSFDEDLIRGRMLGVHPSSIVMEDLYYLSAPPYYYAHTNVSDLLPGRHMLDITPPMCVCVFSSHSFWTSSSLDVPAGVTQEEGHTGFLIHLPSAVRALIFVARRIQPFLSLVDREVEFCVLTN